MAVTKQQLEVMSWPGILAKDYVDELFNLVWKQDTGLQQLIYKYNFVIDYQAWTYQYSSFKTLCSNSMGAFSDKTLMITLLNYAYSGNEGRLDDTVTILDAIKYIKANIAVAFLIAESIVQVFSNLDYINGKWQYKRITFYGLTCDIFSEAPVSIKPSIVKYSYITGINKNIANTSLTSKNGIFEIIICNWWAHQHHINIKNIKTATLEDLIKNTTIEVYIENANNSNSHISSTTDIKHLPAIIKMAIEDLLD